MDELIKLILLECQNILKELDNHPVEDKGIRYGIPPKSAIVKYHDKYDEDNQRIGTIISAWKITLCTIEQITDVNINPIFEPRDGMYFNQGIFLFSINDELSNVIIEWQVGRLYGRGFLYKTIRDDNNIVGIENIKLMWVS